MKINFGAINRWVKRVEMLEEYIVPKYYGTREKKCISEVLYKDGRTETGLIRIEGANATKL